MLFKRSNWTIQGKNPDYRFSLANERTFLAWIRTSLAILLGSIALEQFATVINPEWVKTTLCLFLAAVGSAMALIAFFRWKANEIAMRLEKALPYTRILMFISLSLFTMSAIIVLLLVFGKN